MAMASILPQKFTTTFSTNGQGKDISKGFTLLRDVLLRGSERIFRYTVLAIYVTGFWKTDHNVTLGQLHFLGPANSHTHTLSMHCAIPGLAAWSAFLEQILPTM